MIVYLPDYTVELYTFGSAKKSNLIRVFQIRHFARL